MASNETHCACGARLADRASGILTGYANRRSDDVRICYDCADASQRADMAGSKRYGAYVDTAGNLTTWTGGVLARADGSAPCELTRVSYVHDRKSYRSRWFRDPSGQRWYGRGSPGICINVRKVGG